jgi:hypothetical protein
MSDDELAPPPVVEIDAEGTSVDFSSGKTDGLCAWLRAERFGDFCDKMIEFKVNCVPRRGRARGRRAPARPMVPYGTLHAPGAAALAAAAAGDLELAHRLADSAAHALGRGRLWSSQRHFGACCADERAEASAGCLGCALRQRPGVARGCLLCIAAARAWLPDLLGGCEREGRFLRGGGARCGGSARVAWARASGDRFR